MCSSRTETSVPTAPSRVWGAQARVCIILGSQSLGDPCSVQLCVNLPLPQMTPWELSPS